MSVFGVAVLFALAAGPAMAAKVELPKANGRIIPATLFLVGTSDKEGRPDAAEADASVDCRWAIYYEIGRAHV